MLQGEGARQASALSTADKRPDSTALQQSGHPPRATAAPERGSGVAGAELLVRRSAVAPCVTCGICGRLLRDATAFTECLHAFCKKCIYDKVAEEHIQHCPKCGILLGCSPLEKLRPDHSLQHIRSMMFPANRREVINMRKRKERVSSESTFSSVVGITAEGSAALTPAASQSKAQKVVAEVIDEAVDGLREQNLAPLGRDALSGIRCRDFDSACSFTEETRALIVWQPSPFLEKMAVHNRLASRQNPENFRPPMTSVTEYQRQGSTAKTTDTSFVVGSSSCARRTDDENLREDILAMFNEGIMGRYDAYISKLKAENAKLIEELENETLERTRTEERLQRELENERAAAALEKIRMEERLQRELENERAAAAERTRIIEKSLQRELEREREAAIERIRVLEHEREDAVERIRVLHEELENGREDNQDLRSRILEKSDELATLNYCYDMLESERKHLENQVDHLNTELDYTRKEHRRYASMVLNVARSIPSDLEPINSDARPLPRSRRPADVRVRPSPTGR